MTQNHQDPMGVDLEQSRRRRSAGRRRTVLVLAIPVIAISALVYLSTDQLFATLLFAVIMVTCLLVAWALTAGGDRRRRGKVSPLDEARSAIDADLVREARVEHGESAGITEIRRQVPSLTYEQAVELHRYV